MSNSNFEQNLVDLDYVYIPVADSNYANPGVLNVTNRKTVVFGQQSLVTYPIGNVGNAFVRSQQITTPQSDQDPVNIVGVGPTGVMFKNRPTGTSQIRGNFALLENYSQTFFWQSGVISNNTPASTPVQLGSLRNWSKIATGPLNQTPFMIRNDGTLWGCGYSNSVSGTGAGFPINTSVSSPVQVGAATDWSQVTCGSGINFAAIKTDGTLWVWGINSWGQLGLGDITHRSTPVQVGTSLWSQISYGRSYTVALQSNGTLWSWGTNNYGQLGLSDTNSRSTPVQIGTSSAWSTVACGYYHTLALQSNGTLWSWGSDAYGELGIGTLVNPGFSNPQQVGVSSNWIQITAGYESSAAIQSNGTLWVWGYQLLGALGNGFNTGAASTPVQLGVSLWKSVIKNSSYTTYAIQSNGTLWGWGDGHFGLLFATSVNRSSPIQIGSANNWTQVNFGTYLFMGIKSDGTLWASSPQNNVYGTQGTVETGIPATKLNYGL